MTSYEYSDYLWPSFVSTVLIALLGVYAWRRRGVPGAVPFAFGCLFAVAWSAGAMLQTAAVDIDTKIAWLHFETLWKLPMVTAASCFLLEYAGLKRFLSRRVLVLLAVPPLLFAALILSNGVHGLVWTGFDATGHIQPVSGLAEGVALAYSYLLALFNGGILVWLFVTSRRHRWPVALMITGQLGARLVYELRVEGPFAGRWDADPFALLAVFGLYAVALFGFHVLDPVPEAQKAALDQMVEGMVVLDVDERIIYANPAAERALEASAAELRGKDAHAVLPAADLGAVGEGASQEVELQAGGGTRRQYSLRLTSLEDGRGRRKGRLLLLHDVTDEKAAQARLLEQERVVATLRERERLARELHDTAGQVLGYVSLQAQTIRKRLRDGDVEEADPLLGRLVDVAQEGHADVRESILGLSAGASAGWSFLPALGRYLDEVRANYGVETELCVAEDGSGELLDPEVSVQVLRVVQEAVTNARRHAGRCSVSVRIEHHDGEVCLVVSDDGRGFEAAGPGADLDGHFGLAFMRERMLQVGGSVEIASRPGAGTTVRLVAPARQGQGEEG